MAYGGGYEFGYQDGTGSFLFTPMATGNARAVNGAWEGGHRTMWRHYGSAIPEQKTIIYTSGASALTQYPNMDTLNAADTGSGNGDKMVYPTPTYTNIPITSAEALAIIADDTYADYVSQET